MRFRQFRQRVRNMRGSGIPQHQLYFLLINRMGFGECRLNLSPSSNNVSFLLYCEFFLWKFIAIILLLQRGRWYRRSRRLPCECLYHGKKWYHQQTESRIPAVVSERPSSTPVPYQLIWLCSISQLKDEGLSVGFADITRDNANNNNNIVAENFKMKIKLKWLDKPLEKNEINILNC